MSLQENMENCGSQMCYQLWQTVHGQTAGWRLMLVTRVTKTRISLLSSLQHHVCIFHFQIDGYKTTFKLFLKIKIDAM
jgi:hypothetical protein